MTSTPATDIYGRELHVGDAVRCDQSAVIGRVERINGNRVTVRWPRRFSTQRASGLVWQPIQFDY